MRATKQLPDPTRTRSLERELHDHVRGEVRFDAGSLAAYSTDASQYRQPPIGVVVPVSVDDAVAALNICSRHHVPVLSRGGGTSLAGQCCNAAVVIDWTKYCHNVVSVDPDRATAIVEPGICLDELDHHLESYGLRVGPHPSTHDSCTIGGMIGNNSCGASAQAYGKMAESVLRLEILTYDGHRMWVGATDDEEYETITGEQGRRAELYRGLRRIRDDHAAEIRRRYPDIPRRVSGYNLDSLLPENGFHVARALVGSEGTLATVLHAEIHLVPRPSASTLVVLGYPDVARAADAVPSVVAHDPTAVEGMDDRLVDLEHSRNLADEAIEKLPQGRGWLLVQLSGRSRSEATEKSHRLIADLAGADLAGADLAGTDLAGADLAGTDAPPSVLFLDEPEQIRELWAAREAGLGATAYPHDGPETHSGWEDAAVPPERLGDYLRDFRGMLDRYGYGASSMYGHFGHGCVHTRIPFDLRSAEGIAAYRAFVEEAARLVTSYGGSLSGEHGDGQARGELLAIMFGDRIVNAFEQLKALFDPDNMMNPGKVVQPYRLDENLREGADHRPAEPATHFSFPENAHRFSEAVGRCVGVGNCRSLEGGVMCPSYRATREEEHSTRGRARVLFEMLQGDIITDGWRSTEVRDALDLCLACKGCRSDCPVDVDMATYKAEFLSHHYAWRPRPLPHYSMGWLPVLARLAAAAPKAVNAATHTPGLSQIITTAGGVDRRREIPLFADQRFTTWFGQRAEPPTARSAARHGDVVLWPDTFTENFQPAIGRSAVTVLEAAGFNVNLPARSACCALTWISTGQLSTAKRVLRRTLDVLRPQLRDGTPIVVLEPSCAAVFRTDLPELLHGDEDAHRLARQTRTLAELLAERADDWRPPRLDRHAVSQPHCHQHAVLGFDADVALLKEAGVDLEVLDAGCCGLAGNFGFERGHYDVSMACAEDQLMPALRSAAQGALIIADGFSCRTQIEHADTGTAPLHSAEVLAAGVLGGTPEPRRPAPPSRPARVGTGVATAALLSGAALAAGRWLADRLVHS